MAKFHGIIGYVDVEESSPGVWAEKVTERAYSGDIVKNNRRWQAGENLNDNLALNNLFSVIADPFVYDNFHTMRYVKWMGASWKITNIEIQRPRLILTIGGVYNDK